MSGPSVKGEDEMGSATEFIRHSAKGEVEVIHRPGCGAVKLIKNPLPWNWAQGRDPSEWTGLAWFKPCQRCCSDLVEPAS
jgi:hypothetical protein